jgi:anaphase-promoting complex subunit 4
MAEPLDTSFFTLLGSFTVPTQTRLVVGACNPEKDLVLLIHCAEPRDTLSLWKLQGTKRWEIDVVANFEQNGALRQIAWSPDGPYTHSSGISTTNTHLLYY